MANKDAEGSAQGRPLRDALEFNKPQSEASAAQQSSPASAEPKATIKTGDMLGDKYKVLEVLGTGKAGTTYKVSASLAISLLQHNLAKGCCSVSAPDLWCYCEI